MRFVRVMAAAAALMVGAGQANAVTFIAYEAQGTGTITTYLGTSFPDVQQNVSLFLDFVVETDPIPSGESIPDGSGISVSNGITYVHVGGPSGVFTVDASTANELVITDPVAPFYDNLVSGTINYDGTGSTGLPINLASANASGSLTYSATSNGRGRVTNFEVSKFYVTGPVSTYADPRVGVLPEASTWTMLIAGLGIAGWALRRRQRHAFSSAREPSFLR